jgi:hypothetical protein
MRFRIVCLLLALLLMLGALSSVSTPASAQTVPPTPTSAGTLAAATPFASTNTIYLYQLDQNDIQLTGPYDLTSLVFDLPADWKLTGSAELNLNLTIAVSLFAGDPQTPLQFSGTGGNLTVEFNRQVVGSFPLNQNGETTLQILVPLDDLKPARSDGRQELVFILDSGFSCLVNQQMTVVIHNSSSMTFPHDTVLPDTSLARFPFPIYQNTVYPDSALIVIPDQPTAEELQSALTVAAGLGRLTGLNLSMDLTAISKFSPGMAANQHVILVGKSASLPLMAQLELALPLTAGKFQPFEGEENDGIVQMVHSPWSSQHVVLLVSGNTDAAVVKAAQAVSTGVLRANIAANVSVIQEVQTNIQDLSQKNDFSLLDLGYDNTLLQRRGSESVSYDFYIPPDRILGADAYFELVYGNSALLNYGRSGLVIQVNGQPVGSVRFSDTTASRTMNRVQINIPPSTVVSGANRLEVISSLQPVDNCSVPNLRGMWANIWSESRLHLPLIPTPIDMAQAFDLGDFPAPMTFDSSLSTTAFVLQHDHLESWRSALQIAAYLGDRSNGSISLLQAYYADEVPDLARSGLNLLVIGVAPEMPIVTEMNEFLPAPFETDSGMATERNMQVTFRIPPDSPVGYVEFLASPWSKNNVVIAALGNLQQGAIWAASALYSPSLRALLAGDFAVINDQQVVTTDTRVDSAEAAFFPTGQPGVVLTPPAVDTGPVTVNRPTWILPALGISLALIALILLLVFYNMYAQNRSRTERSNYKAREMEDKKTTKENE